jgi:hypothetical protein
MASPARVRTHYEIYVTEHDRLELHEVTEDRAAALATAKRLAARPDTLVRVMREAYDPERDETVERIVFDSAMPPPSAPATPVPERPVAPTPPPDLRRRPVSEPASGVPTLVVVFGGLGLAVMIAAAGAAIF